MLRRRHLLFWLPSLAFAFPAGPTTTLPAYTGYPNITQLLEEQTRSLAPYHSSLERRQIIGTGPCSTAMQGFTCDMSVHEQNRCVGDSDNYSYCICAGAANGADADGLWLNTAWGPGCEACAQGSRGEVFDGTCNGANGRRGQSIEEIMATLTVTVVVVEISAARPGLSRVRRYR